MNPCLVLKGVPIGRRPLKGLWGALLVVIVLLGIPLVRDGNLWRSGASTELGGKLGLQLGLSVVIRTSSISVPVVSKADWQCTIHILELRRVVYLVTFFLG